MAVDIKFGTAGLRGIMGDGPGNINVGVIKEVTAGLAAYLKKHYDSPSAVIAYDSRNHSEEFAHAAAGVLAAEGVRTYIFREIMPVPVLSYAVRKLSCSAGIMITASHNSREYNGYKVYSHTGGQIVESQADEVQEEIAGVQSVPKEPGSYEYIDGSLLEDYLEAADAATDISPERDISIVYTPLNGAGLVPVTRLLERNHLNKVFMVPEQEQPDGDFPTCPYPNPEKEEVYERALEYAYENDADIVAATDPDCDRAGVMVKTAGGYRLLSGNETGILLAEYICSNTQNTQNKVIVTSAVSTPFTDKVAKAYGVSVTRTPVGFKYIGEQIEKLGDKFLFGFEESNGYLTGTYARDKDGAAAVKMICAMAAHYRAQGKTLEDVLNGLYDKFGCCLDETLSFDIDSFEEAERITAGAGCIAEDGCRVITRRSGTEPKIKIYLSASGGSREEAERRMNLIKEKISRVIL